MSNEFRKSGRYQLSRLPLINWKMMPKAATYFLISTKIQRIPDLARVVWVRQTLDHNQKRPYWGSKLQIHNCCFPPNPFLLTLVIFSHFIHPYFTLRTHNQHRPLLIVNTHAASSWKWCESRNLFIETRIQSVLMQYCQEVIESLSC